MELRTYQTADLTQITDLFYNTVHTVNARDYSQAQLDVWATGQVDPERWDASLSSHDSVVAVEDGHIIGFGDMDEAGYLDRLYVHRDYQGRGVATAICNRLESASPSSSFSTHASITARPFFERRGYRVVKEQQVDRQGILLTNFVMEKP